MRRAARLRAGSLCIGLAAAGSCAAAAPSDDSLPTGIWTSAAELADHPTEGRAWAAMKAAADRPAGTPKLRDMNDKTDVRTMAKALVFARTGETRYREEVVEACRAAIGTEVGGNCLALGRNLVGYVIAADLVGLPEADDDRFRAWLRRTLTDTHDGRTLRSTHEDRPNNWGTHAGASRAAVAAYLGDAAELARVAKVLKGWLGDRESYRGFRFRDLSWQYEQSAPVGVNPSGATKPFGGVARSIDGVLPDDQRRGGRFTWPPPRENYVYEALQGVLVQAVILHRAGHDPWQWEDRALLRAFRWLHEQAKFPAEGDDTWQPHVINYFYDTDFPAPVPSKPGKNVGWTDWTLGAHP